MEGKSHPTFRHELGQTDRERGSKSMMSSASDGGRRSGSGAQGEQLRSEHLPPFLNFLEVGV